MKDFRQATKRLTVFPRLHGLKTADDTFIVSCHHLRCQDTCLPTDKLSKTNVFPPFVESTMILLHREEKKKYCYEKIWSSSISQAILDREESADDEIHMVCQRWML
jgi:hypothetical protein